MTESGLRVGVIGTGYWGSKHVRVVNGLERVASVAIIDTREDRLRPLLRSYPSARAFTSLEAALPHLDALIVATPPSTHVPLALEAIRAGKHVLVEKPLATTTAGAWQLIDEAADAGVVLMAGHTFEYNSAVWRLREIVESGELGDLFYIDSGRLNLGLYQSDVNVVWDLAPHDVSIINLLMGRRPTSVQAWGSRHAHRRFEDVAYLRLAYADLGVSANIHVSWLDPCKVRRVTVVGSKKMAVYNDLAMEEKIRIHDKGVSFPVDKEDLTQPPTSYRYGDITAPYVPAGEPLAVQDDHFVESVVTGAPCLTDGLSGLAVVEVLEAAQLSLGSGQSVPLEERDGSLSLASA
ncbi:Gfo/Idh/MocA family protein [Petropleomorpha daqingensis]|uniref:Gfo/Idh/MocA family protein n=1 Tax=Petropleomorpha daqingensis TaxID=2026353 RepID=UPI001FE4440A|nr:Gfo/Idh/MocA family oxidoreductase [Petropleomorpha daqingensis]